MRYAILVLCLSTAALAAEKPAEKAKPAQASSAKASATRAQAETQGKGLKSWLAKLKERFLRRCQDPWAPDPAPGQ